MAGRPVKAKPRRNFKWNSRMSWRTNDDAPRLPEPHLDVDDNLLTGLGLSDNPPLFPPEVSRDALTEPGLPRDRGLEIVGLDGGPPGKFTPPAPGLRAGLGRGSGRPPGPASFAPPPGSPDGPVSRGPGGGFRVLAILEVIAYTKEVYGCVLAPALSFGRLEIGAPGFRSVPDRVGQSPRGNDARNFGSFGGHAG
jgi:hypothetical protein